MPHDDLPRQPVRCFRDLRVWRAAIELVASVYRTTGRYPADERFNLVSQLRRAAVSVPSNIAEGHGRATRGEYLNQLSVARGSLNEVESLLAVAERVGHTPPDPGLIKEVAGVRRMLDRLATRLRSRC